MAEFTSKLHSKNASITFHLHDGTGTLSSALEVIRNLELNMTSIHSAPARDSEWDYDFFVTFSEASPQQLETLKSEFAAKNVGSVSFETSSGGIAWFPACPEDLDLFATHSLEYGAELDSDHPGFRDPEYRKRRVDITTFAKNYRHGQPLPEVEYTEQEIETWRVVYTELRKLSLTHACKEYNYVFPLLETNCGYSPDHIPQIGEVSRFLKRQTGWTLRPVTGLLTSRDFLNGLAFRVFHSTQYIRHGSKPFYTPEPDVCHELMGHAPMFADPSFADFSQEIGLASLGASDEDIEKLATVYWFTVEFGICREGDQMKAYGAGLLSSFGELEYCLSDKPELVPFNPYITSATTYPITMYQPKYFYTESFEDAKRKVMEFARTLSRPFAVRYDALTETVHILNKQFAKKISADMSILNEAIEKLDIMKSQ